MASEAEASCESDPNFAIICAFIEKFGELCGIGSIDFVDLQNMLENNQEVSPELINIHIKLLRKTKKNVTIERWERALVNMCHNYSSKDAWEIERFGYKKTRLQVRLRALKELLEMQFDYNTKFKNEVNKMSAESLRPQPLGRDKLGRAYWFQTDNNYQIRIYKEDPDEETWQLVAKDRDGLLSLMNELTDGDSKLSSDSALNEDSNSFSEKPFIDTGQSDKKTTKSENDSNITEKENKEKDVELDPEKTENVETEVEKKLESSEKETEDAEDLEEEECSNSDSEKSDEKGQEVADSEEGKQPVLRIKSLSELMETPNDTKKNLLPNLPELTIVKKPKFDSPEVTIVKKPKDEEEIEVSSAVESPVMLIKGNGSGHDNECSDLTVSKAIEEPVMYVCGSGSGSDCNAGNENLSSKTENLEIKSDSVSKPVSPNDGELSVNKSAQNEVEDVIVSEEIEEEVMFVYGEGSGYDCLTGNEKEQTATQQTEKSQTIEACTKLNTSESQNKVPIDTVSFDTEIHSKTETETSDDQCEKPKGENVSVKKTQFFFGPGSLNIKPCPVSPVVNTAPDEANSIAEKSSANNGSVSNENEEKEENTVDFEKETNKKEENPVNDKKEETIENENAAGQSEEIVRNNTQKERLPDSEDSVKEESGDTETDQGKEQKEKEIVPVQETENSNELEKAEQSEEKIQEENKKESNEIVQATHSEEVLSNQAVEENKPCENISEETDKSSIKKEEKILEKIDTVENKVDAEEMKVNDESKEKEQFEKETLVGGDGKGHNEEIDIEQKKEATVQGKLEENDKIEKSDKEISERGDAVEIGKNIVEQSEIKEENKKSDKEEENTASEEIKEKVEKETKADSDDSNIIEGNTKKTEESNKNKTEDSEQDEETKTEKVEQEELPEDTTDEKEVESKEQGPATKRKRMTRNTSALNDSLTEEKMNPRKKVPIEKTKKNQKVAKTSEDNEDESEKVEDPLAEETESKPARQTRQTRGSAAMKAQPPVTKLRGRSKKNSPQASKSDDAASPAPLESVTIVDTDSSNTAAENPEKDPLAVSEEEMGGVNPTVSTITSFSFDYDPSSPAPEKRAARKRVRETLEEKSEVPEKDVKRPKMRGRRNVDQTLRKSVEEKRQQVGDGSSDENEQSKAETKGKGGKKGAAKKVETPTVSDSDNASHKSTARGRKGAGKNKRMLQNLGLSADDISSISESPAPVRQSRRLAQIKIKEEATRRKVEELDISSEKKKKKSDDKDFKVGKRKRLEEEVKPAPTQPVAEKKKKRKAKQEKISIGWETSSEDNDNSCQEEEEVSEYEEHHEEEPLQFKSDHEFSPESDLECDEPLPLKRARTVRKEELDGEEEPEEEFPCQKCGKSDHPEWILLCDKCDNGWHCSCLRPALFVIPEGDWYCPTCQHETLLENLNQKLIEFDKMMVKKEMEDRRKERLAYVGISLNNVLPAKDKKEKKTEKTSESEESSRENTGSGSGSESEESDSDEPIYQLRQRRQAHSYKFQDYDDLINSALQEEPTPQVEKTHTTGRGKDIATIVNAAKEEEEKNGFEDLPPVVPRDPEESRRKALSYRKKPKRLNNLEVNSDDEADDSDEDFKGSSSEESEEEDYSGDSDDSFVGRKKYRPVRRSTRARTTRYDADFINDDDSDDAPFKKKKKKRYFSDSESSLSDDDWRGKKKKSSKKSKKKKGFDSDLENYRKKKPKIRYGMSSDEDIRGRRTRGKKTSYLDTLGSDSDEETLKKKIKDRSDDEYVAEDDEEKESEEEIEKPSDDDDDEEIVKKKKPTSEDSDSEEEQLIAKKVKSKAKRTIVDSEDEDDEEEEENEEKHVKKSKQVEKKSESPKPLDKNQIINEELAKTVREFDAHLMEDSTPVARPEEPTKPSTVPGLNVEKLKACGITVTKIAKDKADLPPSTSPNKLIEIGNRPTVPLLMQRTNPPLNLTKIEKSLDELDEEEVEEMMEDEDFANRQLELAAIQIREAKRKKEEQERKEAFEMKKPSETVPKKQTGGRFFNIKPPQESMLGGSSLVMNDEDNDELSEPPGVTLPLFSELGSMKVQNLSKSVRNDDAPPPPSSPNRAVPVPLHNMGVPLPMSGNQVPNSFGPPRGMMHHMRPSRPLGPRGSLPPMMGSRGPPPMEQNNLSMMGLRGPPQMEHSNPSMVGPRGPPQMDHNSPSMMGARGPPSMDRNSLPMMGTRRLSPTDHNNRSTLSPRGHPPMEHNSMMGPRGPIPIESNPSMMRPRVPPPMDHNNPSMMRPRGTLLMEHGMMRGPPPIDPNNPSMMGLRGPPPIELSTLQMRGNIPRSLNLPPMSSGGPLPNNIPMGTSPPIPMSSSAGLPMSSVATTTIPSSLSMSMSQSEVGVHSVGGANAVGGPNSAISPNVAGGQGHGSGAAPLNESPDGTGKKRRGRGKGKKTLAAEAAAAAAASGGGLPESSKPGNVKPPAANIEIASPPQPFSQSQPAPSVITRMLQKTAATSKGNSFPVGRIRPKQFAMMQDSDEADSPRPPAEAQEKDVPTQPHPQQTAPPHSAHQASHYGPPPGQYPPNYYPKEAQPQQPPHGYHHQRPQPPPMHPYPPHPSQPPMEPSMNPQVHQPPLSISDSSSMGQFPAQSAPPPSKSPFEGMPPHRPPYPNSNPAYNYDYAPPPHMPEESVAPSYENPSSYPDQYDAGSSSMETKGVEDEPGGEFGGLVSYFSSQHEDELEQ